MTYIRIEPTEMETACSELRAQSEVVGQALSGLRAQSTQTGLPPAVAGQVDTTLATLERTLHDIRTELLLEALILALRGILAVKGSAVAGLMLPPPAPEAPFSPTHAIVGGSTVGGGWTGTGFSAYGTAQEGTIAGWTGTGFSAIAPGGSPGPIRITGNGSLSVADLPTSRSPFLEPEGNDFTSWAGSTTRDSDGDGVRNNWDVNPGTYDKEYVDKDPRTKPANF